MKKQYLQPSMKAFTVKAESIICTSPNTQSITSGGSNSILGGPTAAESKRDDFIDDEWE